MKIEDALYLSEIPRLDAEVLLAHAICVNKTWLTVHSTDEVDANSEKRYREYIQRRENNEPVALIIESKEFYGRAFKVTSSVLVPRPATECIIDETIRFLGDTEGRVIEADTDVVILSHSIKKKPVSTIVDIGTGSGCIAITLAMDLPGYTYIATDISTDALSIAKENAKKYEVDTIDFREGILLDPIQDITEPFLLVSNPPYIPDNEKLMKDVSDYEPHTALFGGKDGGDIVRKILQQVKKHPQCQGIILECKTEHASLLEEITP